MLQLRQILHSNFNMKNIIVLGAGSAGLVAALCLKKAFPEYAVKVLESDSIGIIGVGESSTEHWKTFIDFIGADVPRLLRETDATLKKGVKFDNWNGDGKIYFHSIDRAFFPPSVLNENMMAKCLVANDIIVADVLNDTNLIPYWGGVKTTNQYQFNTIKLNTFLHTLSEEAGIEFIKTTVSDVVLKENGDVDYLVGDNNTQYSAEFFVDSSGMKRVISSKLGAQWVSYKKYLPMNHALAFPTQDISDLKPYTLSRALGSGWNWRIATQGRYGNGYVFCDEFINPTQAHDEIQSIYSEPVNVAKDIKFEAGRVDKFWINNCVSIGLASSFVEPLEATSIGNTILQSLSLCKMLPVWTVDRSISKTYDSEFIKSFDNIVDFVQLHYMVKRNDTEFWRALPSMMQKTDFVEQHLETFKKSTPLQTLLQGENNMFFAANWLQVMQGLELFDVEYIKKYLLSSVGESIIKYHLGEYDKYLKDLQGVSFIDHKVLLEQNRFVLKFD